MRCIWVLLMTLGALCFSGCATIPGYEAFYEAETNAIASAIAYSNVVVRLYKNDDEMKSAYWRARDDGATLLGQAAWEGPYTDPDRAKWKAASVGANLVLVSVVYSHTRSGATSLPQYHPGGQTTYSTYSSGNVYGYGGGANYSGRSTTTAYSPGYTTYSYVPYSVARYDHWAVFLRQDGPSDSSHALSNALLSIPAEDEAAISEARRRIQSDPTNPTNEALRLTVAGKYMAYNHLSDAIAEYQAALSINPTNLYAMDQIGLALFAQQKYDESIEQYGRMFLVQPDLPWAHFGLAQCYYLGKKDASQAQSHWNAALVGVADRADPFANCLKARCHWGLALICYFDRKSPSAGSDHAYQAGKSFIDCGMKEDALQMVDLIKSCDTGSPLSIRLTDYIYSKEDKAPTPTIAQ